MQQRDFGRTGVPVGEIGFGAWAIGKHQWGDVRDEDSREAIRAALDEGVTFFDTAQEYGMGHSEELLGEVLGGRDDCLLATKTGKYWDSGGVFHKDYSPEWIVRSAEDSLRRLRTECIGLYQLHNPGPEVSARPETWEALGRLREQGKIRLYGSSIAGMDEARAAIDNGAAALQFPLHLADARALPLVAAAREAGLAVIARSPLAWGALSGKYASGFSLPETDFRGPGGWGHKTFTRWVERAGQFASLARPHQTPAQAAIRYVLGVEGVSVVIPGAKTADQVRENCAAAGQALTADERARIARVQRGWG